MDVAGGEMTGTSPLKLLYPLLFGLQALQVTFGASVLISVARERGLLSDAFCAGLGFDAVGLGAGGARGGGDFDFFKEWQAPTAGALFVVMGGGNFRATIQTYLRRGSSPRRRRTRDERERERAGQSRAGVRGNDQVSLLGKFKPSPTLPG